MAATDKFVHLHVHSQYSLLDGAIRIPKLMEKVKRLGMDAVAVTDHGNMFGAVEFYDTARKYDVKPLVGVETYVAPGSRFEKKGKPDESNSHLTLLAVNNQGYQNLCRLISHAFLEGFYYKPRIDKEILEKHADGLVALSGCLSGEVAKKLLNRDDKGAQDTVGWFTDVFGKDNYFIEVMENGIEDQRRVNEKLVPLARKFGLGIVATGDCHYLDQSDAPNHDVLLCIGTGKQLADPARMKFANDQYYVKSAAEIARDFSNLPEAMTNTVAIGERADLNFNFGDYKFPQFVPPDGLTLDDFLVQQTRAGLAERLPGIRAYWSAREIEEGKAGLWEAMEQQYGARLEHELSIIQSMGFSGYFLIVADFINWAKNHSVPVGPGRGSAAGSLVAYSLRITDIDPIPHNLLFERFLNPERVSMPDIDVDFCMVGRERVLEYVTERYGGSEYVGQIITFGKMQAKAVLRDVGRVMGLPYGEVDRIAKLVPNTLNITLEQALEQAPALAELYQRDVQVKQLVDTGRALEGMTRHAGVHAAGVVIADKPLRDYLPLYRGTQGETVTQFDMKWVEKIGLIKFDFLGLKTLTMMEDCIRRIEEGHGSKVELESIGLGDEKVFELLAAADTDGVFQVESTGMKDLLVRLKPSSFDDIVALVALYRPGPLQSGMVQDFIDRKHGRAEIAYPLPQLEGILRDSYGVILYQEQVMQIASVLAGYSLGEADLLRRAMGKKKAEEMAAQRERFLRGAKEKGIDPGKAQYIFELMEKFAGYGFNRCLAADTEICDAGTGERTTVGDLFEHPRAFRVHALGRDWKLGRRRVTDVVWNGRKPVFELTTRLGKRITATANHPFRTLEGWRNLEDLHPGDRIAAPRLLETATAERGDGADLEDLARRIAEENAVDARSVARTGGWLGRLGWSPSTVGAGSSGESALFGAMLSAATRALGSEPDPATPVPASLLRACDEDIAVFLGALWSRCGFICGPRRPETPSLEIAQEALARDIQTLLLRLSIPARLVENRVQFRGEARTGYSIRLAGRRAAETFLFTIAPHVVGRARQIEALRATLQSGVHTEDEDTLPVEVAAWIDRERRLAGLSWRDLEDGAGVSLGERDGEPVLDRGIPRQTLSRVAAFLSSKKLAALAESDVFWDTVVSVEPRGVQDTYDLTVEDDHNFVADGLIVHNSHSAAYGLITYQTAWLKAHYPVEFMAALLTIDSGNSDKVLHYMHSASEAGIDVLPPDVNQSGKNFAVVDGAIRFGLAAVKGIGSGAIDAIIETRAERGVFQGLADFCEFVDLKRVNRRVVEALIKCGAFDALGYKRAALFAALDPMLDYGQSAAKDRASGQTSLFGAPADGSSGGGVDLTPRVPDLSEWPERERLAAEKEVLGFYITGHPLKAYEKELRRYQITPIRQLAERGEGPIQVAGVVSTLKEIKTKRGDLMAFVVIEDLTGSVEVTIFPDPYKAGSLLLKSDEPVLIRGNLERSGPEETPKVLAEDIVALAQVRSMQAKELHVLVSSDELTDDRMSRLKSWLQTQAGSCSVYLHVTVPERFESVLQLPDASVPATDEVLTEFEKIFGRSVASFQ